MGQGRKAGVLAFLIAAMFAEPGIGYAQTRAVGPLDVLPDVTVTARPNATGADPADVVANRLPRVARCFTADAWSPDPSSKFNQAYYEELTGNADHYAGIRMPPKKVRYTYPPAITTDVFANLTNPGPLMGGGGRGAGPKRPGNPDCDGRTRMEKDVTFARALAMYDKGDHARALETLKEAAGRMGASALGGEAALMIAHMYMKGEGVAADPLQAIAWLQKAARTPRTDRPARYDPTRPDRFYNIESEAAMALGLIYLTGNGVPKDAALARRWVEEAMRAKHVPAFKTAADMYYAGYGGRLNLRDALLHYEVAGGLRHATALYSAASMYDLGEGTRANRKQAVRLYANAADLGDLPSTYAIAVAYDRGDGLPAEPKTALSLYRRAAQKGYAPAQTALGSYFYKGELVPQDLLTARAWFQEASVGGDADGMVNLAAMLTKGEGGRADAAQAWAWLTIAREGGRDDVAGGLAKLEARMSATELDEAHALIEPGAATN